MVTRYRVAVDAPDHAEPLARVVQSVSHKWPCFDAEQKMIRTRPECGTGLI
jgi:hypothetical protein